MVVKCDLSNTNYNEDDTANDENSMTEIGFGELLNHLGVDPEGIIRLVYFVIVILFSVVILWY